MEKFPDLDLEKASRWNNFQRFDEALSQYAPILRVDIDFQIEALPSGHQDINSDKTRPAFPCHIYEVD